MNHNTAAIRKLLSAAFTDEDLTAFCFDRFREIYHKFGRGLTHGEKIQLPLECCETNQGLQHATNDEKPSPCRWRASPSPKLAKGERSRRIGRGGWGVRAICKGEIYGNCERLCPLDGREVELYGYQQ